MESDTISMTTMLAAYRNAKADLYYSRHPRLLDIVDYEVDLLVNLERLMNRVIRALSAGGTPRWLRSPSFVGSDAVVPAELTIQHQSHEEFHSRSDKAWERQLRDHRASGLGSPIARFRQVSRCSIDFHVFSTLWLMKVGQVLDNALTPSAYGNRLFRRPDDVAAVGSFGPYRHAYEAWQNDSFKAVEDLLLDGNEAVVVTADVSSYFHEVDANFLKDERFLRAIGVELDPFQSALNDLFVAALRSWAVRVGTVRGLPVGLPASSVVANAALIELDRSISKEVRPVHYGRYVDDIVIVLRKRASWSEARHVRSWLARSSTFLKGEKGGLRFMAPYLGQSRIKFTNSKNRVIWLEGESGFGVLRELRRSTKQRTSEWRALPALPARPGDAGMGIVSVLEGDGRPTDSLRKTQLLTARRADLALHLRNIEAYQRDLHPTEWQEHRSEVYEAFVQVVLAPQALFQMFPYVGRFVRLATACEDFEELLRMIGKLDECVLEVARTTRPEMKNASLYRADRRPTHEAIVKRWRMSLCAEMVEHIASAIPGRPGATDALREAIQRAPTPSRPSEQPIMSALRNALASLLPAAQLLSSSDLADTPARTWLLPERLRPDVLGPRPSTPGFDWQLALELVDESISEGLRGFAEILNLPRSKVVELAPLIFPTRPPRFEELPLMADNLFADGGSQRRAARRLRRRHELLEKVMKGFGRLHGPAASPVFKGPDGVDLESVEVGTFGHSLNLKVAVANWKSDESDYRGAVEGNPILTRDRYRGLLRFVNSVIESPSRPDYLIMPEISVPERWFRRIAERLARNNVSFIAGVEHIRVTDSRGRTFARNQVWSNLVWYEGRSRRQALLKHDKQEPAIFERKLLANAGLTLVPEVPRKSPRVVVHSGFFYGILVCSEFTNIASRAKFRGNVDALIVPEFNPDIESFGSMVESAALDVHCFIVQCNDREYGDSRIRAPYRDRNHRDIVRVRGGETDVFLIGEIRVRPLRLAQSRKPPKTGPTATFKPYMDGFQIHPRRRIRLLRKATGDD